MYRMDLDSTYIFSSALTYILISISYIVLQIMFEYLKLELKTKEFFNKK